MIYILHISLPFVITNSKSSLYIELALGPLFNLLLIIFYILQDEDDDSRLVCV